MLWFVRSNSKAIEHYEKFPDLRKDADPGIAEVGEARKRLAGLKGPLYRSARASAKGVF
jgi:hypothetical protein